MLKKFEAQQFTAQAEEGMEMIQVAFSIAIAVMLGVIVVSFVNNVIVPGMGEVTEGAEAMFNSILADNELTLSENGITNSTNVGGTTE